MTEAKQKFDASVVRRPLLAAALAAAAVAPAPAMAAFDAFLKLDDIVGESNVKLFPQWINLHDFEVGFNAGLTKRGAAGGAGPGKPSCGEFKLTKRIDRASPPLLLATMSGKHFQKAEIHFRRSSESSEAFLKYELQNVMVSSLGESGGSGDDAPTESLSLNFTKATIMYSPMNVDGKPGEPVSATVSCP